VEDLPWRLDGSFRDACRKSSNWDSPRFIDHSELQLMEFLGPNFLAWDGVAPLPKLDGPSIKNRTVQSLIISYNVGCSASYTNNFGSDHNHHISNRLAKFGSADTVNTTLHFAKLPKKVPAFLISHFIKLTCGATNSDGERRRKIDPDCSVHLGKHAENPFPCYLCDLGSEVLPGDCSRHIFGHCTVIKNAWEAILNNSRCPRDEAWICLHSKKVTPCFILDFPLAEADAGYNRLAMVMCFCWAVHKTIDQVKSGQSAEGADRRIVANTMSFKSIWAPIKKQKQ
jgi:hypothetical protein